MKKIILFFISISFIAALPSFALVRDIQDNHKLIYHIINGDGNHVGSETVTLQK